MKSLKTRQQAESKIIKEDFEQTLLNLQIISDMRFKRIFDFIPFAIVFVISIQTFAGWYSKTGVDLLYLTSGLSIIISMLFTRNLFEEFSQIFYVLWRRDVLMLRKTDTSQSSENSAREINRSLAVFLRVFQERMRSNIAILFGMLGLSISGWIIWLLDDDIITEAINNIDSIFTVYSVVFLIRLVFLLTGFVEGLIGWRIIVIANAISQLGRDFDFELQVNHPDGCGGLKPIGDLCLQLAYIISPFPVLAGLWLIFLNFFDINFLRMSSENIEPLEALVLFLVIPLAVLCLFSFFLPLGSTHSAMLRAKSRLQRELDQISQEIHQIGSELLLKANRLDPKQGTVLEEKIEFLKRVYSRNSQIPVWPYKNSHLRGLITTQIVPTIGVISTIVNFVRDIK